MVDNAVLFLNTIRRMAIYPLDSVIRSLTNPTQIFDGLPTCSRELVEGPRYFQVDLWQVLCVLQGSALLKVSYKKAVIDRFHLQQWPLFNSRTGVACGLILLLVLVLALRIFLLVLLFSSLK